MYKQLQYIGEHLHAVTGVPYVVFRTDADLPEACMIPSCSILAGVLVTACALYAMIAIRGSARILTMDA